MNPISSGNWKVPRPKGKGCRSATLKTCLTSCTNTVLHLQIAAAVQSVIRTILTAEDLIKTTQDGNEILIPMLDNGHQPLATVEVPTLQIT